MCLNISFLKTECECIYTGCTFRNWEDEKYDKSKYLSIKLLENDDIIQAGAHLRGGDEWDWTPPQSLSLIHI